MRRINDRGLINAVSNHDLLITSRGDSTSWCDFLAKKITLIDFKNEIPGDNNDFLFVRNILPIDKDHDLITSHTGLLELDPSTHKFRQLKLYHKGYPLDPTPNYFDLCIDKDRKVWMSMGIGLVSFSPDKETIALIRETKENTHGLIMSVRSQKMEQAISGLPLPRRIWILEPHHK
jgi:sugar lactone lactonase YvrE